MRIKRDWRAIPRTLWIPGIALYLAVMLPWYIAVQLRNPEFFRFFILEHNLARFSSDVYHHHQPFWFYLPVFLLATMPWTLVLILSVTERVRLIWREGKEAFPSPEDSWPLFLLIWMLVPILFFSARIRSCPVTSCQPFPRRPCWWSNIWPHARTEETEEPSATIFSGRRSRIPLRTTGVCGSSRPDRLRGTTICCGEAELMSLPPSAASLRIGIAVRVALSRRAPPVQPRHRIRRGGERRRGDSLCRARH